MRLPLSHVTLSTTTTLLVFAASFSTAQTSQRKAEQIRQQLGQKSDESIANCVAPSCTVVFGHPYRIDQSGVPRGSMLSKASPRVTLSTRAKILVSREGIRIVEANGKYERCLPPACRLIFPDLPIRSSQPIPRRTADGTSKPSFAKMVLFVGNDGTEIVPSYDEYGNIIGGIGRDTSGTERKLEFTTTTESQYVPFQHPIVISADPGDCQAKGNLTICRNTVIPPGCDSFGCTLYKTTITGIYSEESNPTLQFRLLIDPFNYETQVQVDRLRGGGVVGATAISSVKSLRYVLRLDGTGEEHVIDSVGNDSVTTFTIDVQHGTMSIPSKFNTLFPQLSRVNYFSRMVNYMFVHQPLISGGQSLYELGGGDSTINWGRLAGDFVIALAAFAACEGSAGAACMLIGGAGAAGADYWGSIDPFVVKSNGGTTADDIVRYWLLGACAGIDDLWTLTFGFKPQIGCP